MIPDSKSSWANIWPTWVLSAPGGPYVGPMNLAIRDYNVADSRVHGYIWVTNSANEFGQLWSNLLICVIRYNDINNDDNDINDDINDIDNNNVVMMMMLSIGWRLCNQHWRARFETLIYSKRKHCVASKWDRKKCILILISLKFVPNTLRPRQNGRHFADDIFKCIFLNENVWIPIKISLKFVPQGPINNIPALVQKMAWRRPGDKPLSGPMMVRLPTHICVTRPQWVNGPLTMGQYLFR